MTLLRLFLFVACVVARAQAFGNGAPVGACTTLIPKHENSTNVQGAHPQYRLEVPAQVTAGQQTRIILRGAQFRGFIVRALNAQGSSGGGSFAQGPNFKALTCVEKGDAATHDNPSDKTEVILAWTAPSQPGVYTVKATIVERHSTYYTGYSNSITVQ